MILVVFCGICSNPLAPTVVEKKLWIYTWTDMNKNSPIFFFPPGKTNCSPLNHGACFNMNFLCWVPKGLGFFKFLGLIFAVALGAKRPRFFSGSHGKMFAEISQKTGKPPQPCPKECPSGRARPISWQSYCKLCLGPGRPKNWSPLKRRKPSNSLALKGSKKKTTGSPELYFKHYFLQVFFEAHSFSVERPF